VCSDVAQTAAAAVVDRETGGTVRELSDELVATGESSSTHNTCGSMNDDNNSGAQVRTDVITHVTSSSSSSLLPCHVDQWLADVTRRQHGAADRLSQLSCDCTFCVPDANTLTTFTSSNNTTSTTTVSNKPVFTCVICARSFASEKYLNMHAALHRKSSVSSRSSQTLVHALALTTSVTASSRSSQSSVHALALTTVVSASSMSSQTSMHALALTTSVTASSRSSQTSVHALALTTVVTAKDKWTCEVCGKIFAHTSNYKNHIRTHSDERPFVCHVCSIGFKERYHLKKHTLFKHTGELNEVCRRCGKRFKDSTAVRAHERIHSDARPYTCQRCGKAFKTSECLWHHDHRSKTCGRPRRTVDRPPTVCQTAVQAADSLTSLTDLIDQSNCYASLASVDIKSFPRSRALSVAHNGQQSAVKTEDAVFMLNSNVLNTDSSEMMAPPVTASLPWLSHSTKPVAVVIGQHVTGSGIKQRSICSRCGKQFASSLAFERHLAVHSLTRPYRCHICDVGFKLKVHLKKHNLYRHNSDYPCQCRVCGKPFKDSSAVRLHERIHSSARPFQCACGKSFKTRENLWGHRHRRPCVGRYAACASACLGEVSQNTRDAPSCLEPPTLSETARPPVFDTRPASNDVATVADSLLTFDTADYINVDSKLLPPFETFIPPLRTTDSSINTTPVFSYHSYSDWSTAAVPPDVIWWSSPANYQSSPAMMTSHPTGGDVTDDVRAGDWSSDWQLSRKLSM